MGGALRDYLTDEIVTDIDFVINEDIKKFAKKITKNNIIVKDKYIKLNKTKIQKPITLTNVE